MDSPEDRVERKLSDGNSHSAYSLVPDTQDTFPIGCDDYVGFPVLARPENTPDRVPHRIRNKESSRTPINLAEVPAPLCDDRRVYDRQHFFKVVKQDAIEKHLVG